MTLFGGKYRVEPARLKHWDYSAPAAYFVTICTGEHVCWFGRIDGDGVAHYSAVGRMAADQWRDIPKHYDSVVLDAFVLMPNHLHGIVRLLGPHRLHPGSGCAQPVYGRI